MRLLTSFASRRDRMGSPRGPVGVSATMWATKPKFASSAPEIKSPSRGSLQPAYWQRPTARVQRMVRVRAVTADPGLRRGRKGSTAFLGMGELLGLAGFV